MGPGVIFDFDGVVVDSEELHYRAYSEVLAEYGVAVDRALYGRVWIGEGRGLTYAVEEYGLPITPEELKRRKVPVYRRLLEAEVRLMPGADEALGRMSAAFPVALATNSGRAEVGLVLERFGLTERFCEVITREDYEGPKPEPDAFLAAARALGLPPDRCLVVEDAEKGVRAAHAAGCPCVAVPHDFTRENDFSLATRVLDRIEGLTEDFVRSVFVSL